MSSDWNLKGRPNMDVSIYGREAIMELLRGDFPERAAVISFCDPPGKKSFVETPVDYSAKTDRVFRIELHDIDLQILDEYNLTYDTYLPEADRLAEFIYAARYEDRPIICQCEYGQSRSPACAAAIREHFCGDGIKIFADYRYYPNQLVYNKVFDALNAYREFGGDNPYFYHLSDTRTSKNK